MQFSWAGASSSAVQHSAGPGAGFSSADPFSVRARRVALLKRAFQPLECLVSFPAKGIDLGDLISTVVLMRGDVFFQGIVRLLATAERMVSQ